MEFKPSKKNPKKQDNENPLLKASKPLIQAEQEQEPKSKKSKSNRAEVSRKYYVKKSILDGKIPKNVNVDDLRNEKMMKLNEVIDRIKNKNKNVEEESEDDEEDDSEDEAEEEDVEEINEDDELDEKLDYITEKLELVVSLLIHLSGKDVRVDFEEPKVEKVKKIDFV